MTERPLGGSSTAGAPRPTTTTTTITTRAANDPAAPSATVATAAMATATATLAIPSMGAAGGNNSNTGRAGAAPQLPATSASTSTTSTSTSSPKRQRRKPSAPATQPQNSSAPAAAATAAAPTTSTTTITMKSTRRRQYRHEQQFAPGPVPPPPPPPPQQSQPPNFHPYYSLSQEANSGRFYDILAQLDPYRATPKEFVHLLVYAATRDERIADALLRLNSDRIKNPSTWQPPPPPPFSGQPWPAASSASTASATSAPVSHPPNTHTGNTNAPVAATPETIWSLNSGKRKRNEAAEQNTAPTPASSRIKMNSHRMVIYMGPQQPQRTSRPPPPPPTVTGSFTPTFVQVNPAPAKGPPTVPPAPPAPPPEQQVVPSRPAASTPPPVAPIQPVAHTNDANIVDRVIQPIDGEPKEQPCNFKWALDNAKTQLGLAGQYDKISDAAQTGIGHEVARRLQKLLNELNAAFDKHVTLANRVHILTVMRGIIAATLEADNNIGRGCRESSQEFDTIYLTALRKMTPEQLRRLKSLKDGKWVEKMQDLVTKAKEQGIFPLLEDALNHLNSAV